MRKRFKHLFVSILLLTAHISSFAVIPDDTEEDEERSAAGPALDLALLEDRAHAELEADAAGGGLFFLPPHDELPRGGPDSGWALAETVQRYIETNIFDSLPDELFSQILSLLNWIDVPVCNLVCRSFRRRVQSSLITALGGQNELAEMRLLRHVTSPLNDLAVRLKAADDSQELLFLLERFKGSLKQLDLVLIGNIWSGSQYTSLLDTIAKLKSLRSLTFQTDLLVSSVCLISKLTELIEHMTKLNEINLAIGFHYWNSSSQVRFFERLKLLTRLERLELSGLKPNQTVSRMQVYAPESIVKLAASLAHFPNLKSFKMRAVKIQSQPGNIHLLLLELAKLKHLQSVHLDLQNYLLTEEEVFNFYQALSKLKQLSSVHLSFGGKRLQVLDCTQLGSALAEMKLLKHLVLAIGPDSIDRLETAGFFDNLALALSLKQLSINFNHLSAEALSRLHAALGILNLDSFTAVIGIPRDSEALIDEIQQLLLSKSTASDITTLFLE